MRKTIQLKFSDAEVLMQLDRCIRRTRLRWSFSQAKLAKRCDVTIKTDQTLEAGIRVFQFPLQPTCVQRRIF